VGACGPPHPKAPAPELVRRLDDADALVRAGCLDCLLSAFREYDALEVTPGLETRAATGAFRAAVLIGVRERELGLPDDGYLQQAGSLIPSGVSTDTAALQTALEAADAIPTRAVGGSGPQDDEQLARSQRGRQNFGGWLTALHPQISTDPVVAYIWLSLNCEYNTPSRERAAQWKGELTMWEGVPLLDFRKATCRGIDAAALDALFAADARFAELHYYFSLDRTLHGQLRAAAEELRQAYAWRSRWPAVTIALANQALAAEDYEVAARYYDETLAILSSDPQALLGKLRALTYIGRYVDAIAAADRLISLQRWNLADARYWRAYDLMQLNRLEEAWNEVRRAEALLVSADVSKLAGMIAYRQRRLEIARMKFAEAHERDDSDCEASFYLGATLAELSQWAPAQEILVQTGACLDAAEARLNAEIDTIRGSSDPPDRKQSLIQRRTRQIETGRRMRISSWYNLAFAAYNLGELDAAREYAEKVVDDPQFGAGIQKLLAKMGKSPSA
jgi:tetratricopeptide (TPR) repeat protein